MTATLGLWSGANTASDLLLLLAAIAAGCDAAVLAIHERVEAAFLPVAVALIALGLMAL